MIVDVYKEVREESVFLAQTSDGLHLPSKRRPSLRAVKGNYDRFLGYSSRCVRSNVSP